MRAPTRQGFTGELWAAAESTYEAILRHPFLTELADGSLDVHAFRFYLIEDAYYLGEFARALTIIGAKAPKDEWIVRLNRDSIGTLEAERAMHERYFEEFGLSREEVQNRSPAPTNLAYTNFLIATAFSRPFAEGLAAVLPCYWIYAEVGKELAAKGSPNALFQRWVDEYSSPEYDIVDEVAAGEGAATRQAMLRHYMTTSRYEWMFWDMGYRQQAWPV
jgi:thiaminase/transcriptional activator TenA